MASFKSEFLNTLSERGFVHQISDAEGLDAALHKEAQSAYIGFDATARSLHVGNLMGIMMLYWFQKTGHKPITLMGGGTTQVGDPSGKDETRKLLTTDEIKANITSIKNVFNKYLHYGTAKTEALMVNNADWLLNLNYLEFLREYGPHFSINRMLTFDSVKLRLEREQSLSLLEFNYMICQAYDFLELYQQHGTLLQMGGSDQWGNIINGVELIRRMKGKTAYALTCPLITTSSGAKMGKTAEGAVWLNADMKSPYEYYQFWRNTEDADVSRFLKFYTILPMEEIHRLETLKGSEINEAKKVLAFEATKLCHGEIAAQDAAETARQTFEEGGAGENLPTFFVLLSELNAGLSILEAFVRTKLCDSKADAKRLIQGNGARINDQPVIDANRKITGQDLNAESAIKLTAGKKRHALIKPAP